MAQFSFSNAATLSAILFAASLAALTAVSGQEMAPAPSPSLVTGAAAFSAPVSVPFLAVSLAVCLVGLLKM